VSESAGAKRRGAVALVVIGAHVTAFLLMRHALLHPKLTVEVPEFVSLWLTSQTAVRAAAAHRPTAATRALAPSPAARETLRAAGAARAGAQPAAAEPSVERATGSEPKQASPLSVETPHAIDWLGEAEHAARDEVASEADRKRSAEWLSRATEAQTHPLVRALKPLYGKTPAFGWSHARTHRIEAVKGGPLLIWITDRCLVVFAGLAILPVCKIGHMEANGALFEHMHDAAELEGALATP
jgi:hypothetical protein